MKLPFFYLGLEFGLGIDTLALAQLLQLLSVLGCFTETCEKVEAFPWLGVGLLLQLHGVTPRPLGFHHNQQQVSVDGKNEGKKNASSMWILSRKIKVNTITVA